MIILRNSYIVLLHFFLIACSGQDIDIVELPKQVHETSTLVYFDGLFWTINDSGGKPIIYGFDQSGKMERIISVNEVKNHDWEALAISDQYMLIGDFGNNLGNRKNLQVILVPLNSLSNDNVTPAGIIDFQFSGQNKFIYLPKRTEFDCEAFIVKGKKIYLFTKDWKNNCGSAYKLDIEPGEQVAEYICPLNAGGLITDATLHGDSLYLIGYKDFKALFWVYDFSGQCPNMQSRTIVEGMKDYQVEGICVANKYIYVSTEKSAINQSLIKFRPIPAQ